ncbi:MAG: alpha-1,4-glucan--maltose-1-phosphate maltosyltransferase [Acidimicrobiales bacterium]
MKKVTARRRPEQAHVVVESVDPIVDGGRFPAKAVAGMPVEVSADVFSHGHEPVRAHVRHRRDGTRSWSTVAMSPVGNDRYVATVTPAEPGLVDIEVLGEVDRLASWRHDASRRAEAGRFDPNDPVAGAALLAEAANQLAAAGRRREAEIVGSLSVATADAGDCAAVVTALRSCDAHADLLASVPPTGELGSSYRFQVLVGRRAAAFSSWYECFPRSTSPVPGRHGTLRDLVEHLDYVARLGFDVLYLPPIHPIGTTARKGRNNAPVALKGDVGSPWAIGSPAGGHKAVAPPLGTLDDLDALVAAAQERGIEIALDLAFQCSPDHPWVTEHPDWFAHRPDGTIACAENPPKRYEDVYPLDFDTPDRDGLHLALLDVVLHWLAHGIRIFRVDNPHTKPFGFWEWMIAEIRRHDPGVVFLSEAFTRPKVMHRLAKLGFDQSYTYFTWRSTKNELEEYFDELAHGPGRTYLRPNVWPNTPDILPENLQRGGRASFVARLVLAGCLSACYGIYGPVFELLVDTPASPGSEEYADSEKYQIGIFDRDDPRSIADVVARVNAARTSHPALQANASLHRHTVDNDQLMCWSKRDVETGDTVVCVVSLDPLWPQSGFVDLDLPALGLADGATFSVRDELTGASYTWTGRRNFVLLDPSGIPAHLFSLEPAAVKGACAVAGPSAGGPSAGGPSAPSR